MHFDKALSAELMAKDVHECHGVFTELLEKIVALPPEVRGAQALRFCAELLELAAFELAGDIKSEQIGALIRCAAELSEQSTDVAADKMLAISPTRGYLQ